MKNNNYLFFATISLLIIYGCKQKITIKEGAFIAINPLSYTDVIYNSIRDTVLISTFNGRIIERINQQETEKLLINLSDEIYSLAYDSKKQLIYASTLNSGIVVIDSNKKYAINKLPIDGFWISKLYLSKNGEILAGQSSNRKNYIWDLRNNFTPIILPEKFLAYKLMGIANSGSIILKNNEKYIFWNPFENFVEKEIIISGDLKAIDSQGNMLLFNDKEFLFYNVVADSIFFKKNHEFWPYYLKDKDTIVKIPLRLSLTVGELTNQYIFTAGVDRSLRKWTKTVGQPLEVIVKHKATISAIDLSSDQTQIVSVDLKGGILFNQINNDTDDKEKKTQ